MTKPTTKWSAALSVSNDRIDEQHRGIFALADDLPRLPPDPVKVAVALVELQVYVAHHLREEEELMLLVQYPNYEAHRALHVDFETSLQKMSGRLPRDPALLVLKDVRLFVTRWLYQHITHVDLQLAPYLKKIKRPA